MTASLTRDHGADDPALIDAALARDGAAVRRLVDRLTPIVQARVARVLLRSTGSAKGRDVRQEVADMAQDVFAALFEDDGRVLRTWSPDRGASLDNFVGLVATRQAMMTLRSRRRSPWTEDPTAPPDLGAAAGGTAPAGRRVHDRALLAAVLERIRAGLSPKGQRMFQLLMIEQRTVDEVCAETGSKAPAVYAWRSRLARQAREIRDELLAGGEP